MTDLIVVPKGTDWRRLKALVLDSVRMDAPAPEFKNKDLPGSTLLPAAL
jgi:hypothetical protein